MESFIPLPNVALADAPTPVLIRRDGDEAEVFGWTAGDADLHRVRTFPAAFADFEDGLSQVTLSPDGRALLMITVHPGPGQGPDRARLVTADGGVVWNSDAVISAGIGGVWSTDSAVLALTGAAETIWLVTIDPNGSVTPRAIQVDGPVGRPSVEPSPSTSLVVPVGFSEDGRWLYGARRDLADGATTVVVRVAVPDGTVEPVSGVGPAGPGRLDPTAQSFADPATGRTVRFGPNAATPGGPPVFEVHESDGSLAFRVEGHVVGGYAWIGDGRLAVVEADALPFPSQVRAVVLNGDGDVEATMLETGAVGGSALLGVVDGHAVLAFFTDQPRWQVQVVLVRLSDLAASAVVLNAEVDKLVGGGILP